MRKSFFLLIVVLALFITAPIFAKEDHTSCKAFGQFIADAIETGDFLGQGEFKDVISATAKSGPKALSELVKYGHDQLCQSK